MQHALCFALAATAALAQSPSPWSSLHFPAGVTAAQAVSQGKLITYRDGGSLHAWSAVTRRWATLPASGTATLRINNDCLLVQDGTTWTAFAAYRGTFEPLPVSSGALLLNATNAVNDSLLLVHDGGFVHAFSAFVGTWTARPASTSLLAAVQRHVAVLVQGTTVSGLDAATGQWHDQVVAVSPTSVSADGTAAFAFGAGTVHAFSATHTHWRNHAELVGATFTRADDWAVWSTQNRTLGFSAVRGEFATASLPVTTAAAVQDVFALFDGTAGVFAFSALTGEFSGRLAAPGALVNSNTTVALLTDAAGTRGYSAVHNRVAMRSNVGVNSGTANVVAWVSDANGGPPWFFSALTCSWHRGPTNVLGIDPTLTTTAAASLTTTGCVAFSPRTCTFVALLDPTVTLVGSSSSAPLVAVGATSLHAFDARSGRWISTPRAGTGSVTPQVWRTGAVLFDGTTAFGFGVQAGSWWAQTLPGAVTGLRANSESTRVQTANDVFAWSAVGEIGWFAQFPEFRRVQPNDTALRLVVALPANGLAIVGIGTPAATPLLLPGLGELLLVPTAFVTLPIAGSATGVPVIVLLATPTALPAGREIAAQACMLPPGGIPYLSDVATVLPQ